MWVQQPATDSWEWACHSHRLATSSASQSQCAERVQYALQLVHVAVLVCCHKAVPAEPVEQPEDSCS
jgi:hypothetical protein